jgi:hypothetical protein
MQCSHANSDAHYRDQSLHNESYIAVEAERSMQFQAEALTSKPVKWYIHTYFTICSELVTDGEAVVAASLPFVCVLQRRSVLVITAGGLLYAVLTKQILRQHTEELLLLNLFSSRRDCNLML